MKQVFFVFATLFLSTLFVSAQETHFGLKAGLNVSSVNVSPGGDYDSKAGLHVGGLAHIHISRHFALQPEVVYSMQGGKVDDVKLKLNYINIPLLAQYMVDNGFRLQTGPQLGLLVSSKREAGDVEVNLEDNFSTVDFSWAFGMGYLFPAGFGVDARYNLGINDIYEPGAAKLKNSVFQVGFFYQFMHNAAKRK
ncbi:porin family protein [Terrimonas pollutisoli]|uniref:porin family protein n=1 Tax=Terrimonas pollutisoli TaxID=3034147 RepID=UPI0023ED08C2|nr:porin family protein [Terrimonas sp. H1YJ31]